jgi:hypothetical protein
VRGVTVTDRIVREEGREGKRAVRGRGPGGEEEERLLQERHCKDSNRIAVGLGV